MAQQQTIDWADVARWAGEQPRDGKYEYFNNGDCALAQYLRARGVEFLTVLGGSVLLTYHGDCISWSCDDADGLAIERALQSKTFGGLHDGLMEMLA